MNQSIKDSLILPEGSTLFILGDILFGDKSKLPELVEHIRKTCSRLYLLYGNHDDYIRKNAEYVSLFDWCGDYTEIVVDKTLICLSHYPIRSWRDHNKGSFCLYGHCHCTISGLGRSMDVGWDYKNKPLNYEEIYQELIQIDPHKVDHH
jgi:calcineurin-like phosphoesterase family protein